MGSSQSYHTRLKMVIYCACFSTKHPEHWFKLLITKLYIYMYVLYVKSQSLEVSKIKNNKKNFEKFLFIFSFETSSDCG